LAFFPIFSREGLPLAVQFKDHELRFKYVGTQDSITKFQSYLPYKAQEGKGKLSMYYLDKGSFFIIFALKDVLGITKVNCVETFMPTRLLQ